MIRKSLFSGNLIKLLVSFAAGYAAAYLIATATNKLVETAPPAIITQPTTSEDPSTAKDPQASAATPAPADATTDVAALQAQLAEKSAKIEALERKLASPSHDVVTPEEDTPEYREKLAAELLELTQTKDMIQQAFKASGQLMGKDLTPEGQEAMAQAVSKIFSWEKMEKQFSKIFTEMYSAQELTDLAEFYRSELGVAMLKKQPEVMQRTMQMVQQMNQEALPKLIPEIEAITKKHSLKTATGKTPENAPVKN